MSHPVISRPGAATRPAAEDWQQTRSQTLLATQFLGDEEKYLGGEPGDIGRPLGENDRELFVSCAPGEALQQQFDHLQKSFIAVHDIATRSSRQLVAGVAALAGRPLQKLTVRRQGFGTVLASIHFADLQGADGAAVRLYSTDILPAAGDRHGVARALLANSRLGVLMVGEMAAPALAAQMARWRGELTQGAWPNRHLLLLPLSSANALSTSGIDLALGTPVLVRSTPKVTRAAEAWEFIHSTWTRLGGPLTGLTALNARAVRRPPDPPPQPVAPAAPAAPAGAAANPSAGGDALARYAEKVAGLEGVVGCCVFDLASGQALTHAGHGPQPALLARHGNALLAAMSTAGGALGLAADPTEPPDAAITFGSHHLLLRRVPNRPGLALHAVLDRSTANLTLARLRLERLDDSLTA